MKAHNGKQLKKEELVPIRKGFSGTFNNTIYIKEIGANNTIQVLWLFNIFSSHDKTFQLRMDSSDVLHITYHDTLLVGSQTKSFKGKVSSRGYYEVFTKRNIKEIPPVFSIIYSSRDTERLRLALHRDGTLLLDDKWEKKGNIFLMSAGGGNRILYYVNAVK